MNQRYTRRTTDRSTLARWAAHPLINLSGIAASLTLVGTILIYGLDWGNGVDNRVLNNTNGRIANTHAISDLRGQVTQTSKDADTQRQRMEQRLGARLDSISNKLDRLIERELDRRESH